MKKWGLANAASTDNIHKFLMLHSSLFLQLYLSNVGELENDVVGQEGIHVASLKI